MHDVYCKLYTYKKLKSGFKDLYEIFLHCYEDISADPVGMLLPMYDMTEFSYSSKEARLSKEESYKYANISYVLGYTGELKQNSELHIQVNTLKNNVKF